MDNGPTVELAISGFSMVKEDAVRDVGVGYSAIPLKPTLKTSHPKP